MTRAVLIMDGPSIEKKGQEWTKNRAQAALWIKRAPEGTRVTFQGPQRSLAQSDKLHAMLSEIAMQVEYYGQKRTVTAWKFIFMDALAGELETVPSIDGQGLVSIGRSTSDLSKAEMSDLIEIVYKFGADRGVRFKDTPPPAEPRR